MRNLLLARRNTVMAACLICLIMLAAGWAFFSADAATAQGPALAAPAAAADEPVLKAYDVGGQDPAVVAAKLQSQLPANAGINIATDKRTGRVLVLAAPSAQDLIAKLLQQPAPMVPAAPAKNAPAVKADPGPRTERSVTLAKLTAPEFEQALSRLANRQLPMTTDASGQIVTYTLAGRDNAATMLTVNRTDRTVTISGGAGLVDGWSRVIAAMDRSKEATGKDTEVVVPIRNPEAVANGSLQRAMQLIGQQTGGTPAPATNRLVSMLFQPRNDQPAVPAVPATPNAQIAEAARTAVDIMDGGLSGPVSIEYIESLDIIVIRASNQRDADKVSEIIRRIEEESQQSVPEIQIYPLQNVSSDAMASLVRSLYDQVLSPRQGRVSITSLVKPNALLLIGRKESIASVIDLIKRLDVTVDPSGEFRIFELKHTAANEVLQTVQAFLSGASVGQGLTNQNNNAGVFGATITATGLGTRAVVTADYRTNSLIVRASKRDLDEIEALLKEIDKSSSSAVNELKVFNLKYSLAEELAPVLQSSVTGTAAQNRTQGQQGNQGGQGGQNQLQQGLQQLQQQGQGQNQNAQQRAARSIMLQFLTVDSQGKKLLKSGLLTDVRITADGRANSIIVSAPAESMELIGALIRELDQMPTAEAQIKVFTIQNGDASNLVTMLQNLFGLAVTGGGAANQRGGGGAGAFNFAGAAGGDTGGDNPLVGLRFSVDQRTNSIIVSGSSGDLNVVEAILLRLDESDIRQRKSTVYRLKNAPAIDVANSITQLLNSERQLQQVAPQQLSPFQQIEKEVVVVPEQVSNSLIISATPRYFDEIRAIIEQLDMRPPMVMIQVLIAEVQLANNDEFGVELGVQDSVLFDRSLLGNLVSTTNTTTFGNPATTVQQQNVLAATNEPGYNFNNQPLGNSGSSTSLANADAIGPQGLTNFALGRTNSELGFGGLVLSASSNSLSVLLRALSANRRLEVLSRPQIMTLDNQPAFIQVGQRVPRITSVSVNLGIQNNAITLENVGLILGVTPRISPDGLVVMEIDAEKSEVGPESEGVPIFVNTTGQVVRSPRFNTSVAQTTVSAANGQTIILGGLIAKSKTDFSRRAPFLSDIPVLGHFFRYDSTATTRRELLIIMTPRVVRTQQDSELVKQVESARMSWCLSDVMRIHGPSGLRTRNSHFNNDETLVIYPDQDPNGEGTPHMVEEEGVHHMLPGGEMILPGGAIPQQIMSTPAAPGTIISGQPVPPSVMPNKTVPGYSIPGETGTFSKPIPGDLPPPLPPNVIPPSALPRTPPGASRAPDKQLGQRPQQAMFRSADATPAPAVPSSATGPALAPANGPTLAPPQANIQLPPPGLMNAGAWQQQTVGAPGVMPASAWQNAAPLSPQQSPYAQTALYQTPAMPPANMQPQAAQQPSVPGVLIRQ
jgi:general secretion pathway protein D